MHPEWQNLTRLLCCLTGDGNGLEPALDILRQLPAELFLLSGLEANVPEATIIQWNLTSLTSPQSTKLFAASLPDFIKTLQTYSFEAAIIFTPPDYSPYAWGYLCYLAGIPTRLGQSQEFGGSVLTCVTPPIDPVPPSSYYLHLLSAAGLYTSGSTSTQSNSSPTSLNHAVTNSNLAHSR